MSKNKGLFDLGAYQKSDHLKPWKCGLIVADLPKSKRHGYSPMFCIQFVDSICECFEIGVELDSYTDKE